MAKSKQHDAFLTDAEESALKNQVETVAGPVVPEPKKSNRSLNPELQAMAKIDRILSELSLSAQDRVIDWLSARSEEVKVSQAKRSAVGCSGSATNASYGSGNYVSGGAGGSATGG